MDIISQVINRMLLIILITSCLLLTGCLSVTTMQTGRTLGKNNSEILISGSYGKYSQHSCLDIDGEFDNKPLIGLRGQYGISKKIDLGLSIDQASFMGSSIKFQFIGNSESKIACGIGAEVGLNLGASLYGNLTYYESIPLYLSYHPRKNVSIYLTPRYLYTAEKITASDLDRPLGINNCYRKFCNSYGIIIGNKHKIAIEISNWGSKYYEATQFSIGYLFMIKK